MEMDMRVYKNTADISLRTLIRECRNNKITSYDLFQMFRNTNRENISTIFKYKTFNDDFTDTLSCYSDGTNIVEFIRPSYNEFLTKLLDSLNIKYDSNIIDDEELTQKMLDRIEVLKRVSTIYELESNFPKLYKDLVNGRKYLRYINEMKKQNRITESEYNKRKDYFYSCGLKRSLGEFIKTQSEMYKRYVTRRYSFKERLRDKSYNKFIKKYFDTNKLAMLVVHEYLSKCEKSNDEELIKEYIRLVEMYLESDYDKNDYIVLDNGKKIDLNNIYQRLENIKNRLNNKTCVVDWVLIPETKTNERVKKVGTPRETLMNYERIEKLRKIGESKTSFYELSGYLLKVVGLQKNKGYVAYIYPNGKVILDREYDSNAPSTAIDNRFFVIDAKDFFKFSGKDKKELLKNEKVKHYNHSKKWRSRARKIIEQETSEEAREEAQKLKIKIKSM